MGQVLHWELRGAGSGRVPKGGVERLGTGRVPLGALGRQVVRVLLMSGTSSFCRRWAESSKTPGHRVSTAVSSLWPPGAGDPEAADPRQEG